MKEFVVSISIPETFWNRIQTEGISIRHLIETGLIEDKESLIRYYEEDNLLTKRIQLPSCTYYQAQARALKNRRYLSEFMADTIIKGYISLFLYHD